MINRAALLSNPAFAKFIARMDSSTWFRLVVCFAPGLIIAKISQMLKLNWLSIVASIIVVFGILIYAGWTYGRKKLSGVSEESEAEVSDVENTSQVYELQPVLFHITLINEMESTGMTPQEILDAIKLEASVWPETHLAEVIEAVHRRKMLKS